MGTAASVLERHPSVCVRLIRNVAKDAAITYDMVALDIGATLDHRRALQDGDYGGRAAAG